MFMVSPEIEALCHLIETEAHAWVTRLSKGKCVSISHPPTKIGIWVNSGPSYIQVRYHLSEDEANRAAVAMSGIELKELGYYERRAIWKAYRKHIMVPPVKRGGTKAHFGKELFGYLGKFEDEVD